MTTQLVIVVGVIPSGLGFRVCTLPNSTENRFINGVVIGKGTT
jgi:NO-binding membrane sensor protein with MHYT domain